MRFTLMKVISPILLVLVGCGTQVKKFEDRLAPGDQERLEKTVAKVKELAECSENTKGNDAAFTKKCSKLLSKGSYPVKFRALWAAGPKMDLALDASSDTTFRCMVEPVKKHSKKYEELKELDDLEIRGRVSSFQINSSRASYGAKPSLGYIVNLDPCFIAWK